MQQTGAALLALLLASCRLSAQSASDLAGKCGSGVPAFSETDAHRDSLLQDLKWPNATYDSTLAALGPVSAFDTLLLRARRLTDVTVTAPFDRALLERLRLRLDLARVQLGAAAGFTTFRSGELTMAGVLKPGPNLLVPGDAAIGDSIDLSFAPERRVASTAICAVASTANQFLVLLMSRALDAVAGNYAAIARRWVQFTGSTYSLTFVERFAASCHIPILDWIMSPTSRCWAPRRGRWQPSDLEPPHWRTVFVHPSAGLRPLFKSDSAFQSAALVEWYGFLHHTYGISRVTTWGATFATAHFESGPSRLGGVLHTPYLKIGVFDARNKRVLVTVSADLVGWVPGVRRAADKLRIAPLQHAIGQLNTAPQ